MRITSLSVQGLGSWPALELIPLMLGVNVVYGPAGSGKTTVAEFLAHVLYGQPPATERNAGPQTVPAGEAVVESDAGRFRLRRHQVASGTARLTVSALDGAAVDHDTVRRILGGVPTDLLRGLYVAGFRQPPDVGALLSAQFAREFELIGFANPTDQHRRTELMARRDTLAKELETRLAGDGRASRDLDARRRDLDRQIADGEREATSIHERWRSVEAALLETDTRLRYRRLELNADRIWWGAAPVESDGQLAELDEQISRSRQVLAELAGQEANVRAQLANLQSIFTAAGSTAGDERAWLAVARQLTADLSGEVARLARSSVSQQCVCRDAHPRLRPIVETLARQLDVLATLITERQHEWTASELAIEAGHLMRSQSELTRHLEFLLERRQAVARGVRPYHRLAGNGAHSPASTAARDIDSNSSITAADAQHLEQRRLELEQERYNLGQTHAEQERALRELRAERATVDRQRAALLSARSIEHVQRELAVVQQKLQLSLPADGNDEAAPLTFVDPPRASEILAKLTDGRLVRIELVEQGRSLQVWRKDGSVVRQENLYPAERDQVYLSFCLALAAAVSRQRVACPLLLDEPFLRLNASETAALAAVLDEFGRQGQQVVVFTSQREAADRMASLGAPISDLHALRWPANDQPTKSAAQRSAQAPQPAPTQRRQVRTRKSKSARRSATNGLPRDARRPSSDGESSVSDRHDAA